MQIGWKTSPVLVVLLAGSIFSVPGLSFAEKADPPKLFFALEGQYPFFDQGEACPESLLPKLSLKKLFQALELDKLPGTQNVKLDNESLIALLKVVQEAYIILTCPENFKQLTSNPERLARRLGFESVDQIVKAQPGPALLIKRVALDKLSNFVPTGDPDDLMTFARQIIVPLIDPATEMARSSLTFTLFDGSKWRWTRRGASNRIQTIQKYRNHARELVVIPGLNLSFLAGRSDGQLELIPLYDTNFGGFKYKAGQVHFVTEIFTQLAPKARSILVLAQQIPQGGRKPLR